MKQLDSSTDSTLDLLAQELAEGNLVPFVGAGLSVGAGFPSWIDLLAPLAEEIGVQLRPNSDLPAIAQYYFNDKGHNRSRINGLIKTVFSRPLKPTAAHLALIDLPITSIWTTNYDRLLEAALAERNRTCECKWNVASFSSRTAAADVTLYKMHGDFLAPESVVLTKHDYESYQALQAHFLDTLRAELSQRTFLFLGFSFSDCNIEYVFGRLRTLFGVNRREHFAVIHAPVKEAEEDADSFAQRCRLAKLFIDDLANYGITTISISSYSAVHELLVKLRARVSALDMAPKRSVSHTALYETLRRTTESSGHSADASELVTLLKCSKEGRFFLWREQGQSDARDALLRPGMRIQRGDPIAFLISGQTFGTLRSPVSGRVQSVILEHDRDVKAGQWFCLIKTQQLAEAADGFALVRASEEGTFYRAAAQQSAPIVKLDDLVRADAPLYCLEVAKLFATVPSPYSGKIRAINVPNDSQIKGGDALFLIETNSAPRTMAPVAHRMLFRVQRSTRGGTVRFSGTHDDHAFEQRPGSIVGGGDVIALIVNGDETSPVEAEYSGTIFQFHCQDGALVENNTPLFSVAPPETMAALKRKFRAQVADGDGAFMPSVVFGSKVLDGEQVGILDGVPVVSRYTGMITEVAPAGAVKRGELLFRFDPPAVESAIAR